jgi:hypothetical protein
MTSASMFPIRNPARMEWLRTKRFVPLDPRILEQISVPVSVARLSNGDNVNFKYSIGEVKEDENHSYKTLLRNGQPTHCFLNQNILCTSMCAAFNLYDGVFELKCMPQLAEYGHLHEPIIPTLDQVLEQFKTMKKDGGREFYLHYKSVGWMVGKSKVKDWVSLAEKWKGDIKAKGTSFGYKTDPSKRIG